MVSEKENRKKMKATFRKLFRNKFLKRSEFENLTYRKKVDLFEKRGKEAQERWAKEKTEKLNTDPKPVNTGDHYL